MADATAKRPYLLRIIGTWGLFLLLSILLSLRLGPIPPLGAFLSPVTGYLKSSSSFTKKRTPETLRARGLKNKVTISVDVRGIPHVTADNDFDLAFGQGFATARDRLWQMELQTAATAGRISELLGEKAFEFDKKQRRLGFLASAESELDFLKKLDPEQFMILESYSRGVNAYIDSLSPENWPIEYKLLGASPERWNPLKCILFHKQMIWILTGNFDDFKFTNALQRYSKQEIETLFPDYFLQGQPIVDASVAQISAEDPPLIDAPSPPFRLDGLLKLNAEAAKSTAHRGTNGSNNWVVDGLHTNHGYPVLANDPHLDLKLPSIWYEIQLTAPGVNVYGVTLPGLPHVIIGFNDDVSWGITNAGVDVLDWYAMKLDKTTPTPNYYFAQQWKPSTVRKEIIHIKGQPPRTIDLIQTHLGPIAQELPLEQKGGGSTLIPFAMKWTGHSTSNDFKVFYALNRSHSVLEMKNALQEYHSPGQNFVMADKTGSIGYVQAGRFPARSPGFGRFVLDGTKPSDEWKEEILFKSLPQSWSPDRGYLFSANQQPTRDPIAGYASGEWAFTSYLRANRINQRLAEITKPNAATITALMNLQNDVLDLRAQALLPLFSRWALPYLKDDEKQILQSLSQWNFELKAESQQAAVWSTWWNNVYEDLWEKAFPAPYFRTPSEDKTMELLLSSDLHDWPPLASIPARSEVPLLIANAFRQTIKTLQAFSERNNLHSNVPTWGEFRGTNIPHIANIPGFGRENLKTGGSSLTVNATTQKHGPSWRMVVTWVDAQPRAWGIYPGGPSGDAGSPFYANMIEPWLKGQLEELLFAPNGQLKESLSLFKTNLEGSP